MLQELQQQQNWRTLGWPCWYILTYQNTCSRRGLIDWWKRSFASIFKMHCVLRSIGQTLSSSGSFSHCHLIAAPESRPQASSRPSGLPQRLDILPTCENVVATLFPSSRLRLCDSPFRNSSPVLGAISLSTCCLRWFHTQTFPELPPVTRWSPTKATRLACAIKDCSTAGLGSRRSHSSV